MTENSIEIYTTTTCPYCLRAKALLTKKNLTFTEIKVESTEQREELAAKSAGRKTVPQIFINGKHIGGCDDLHALEASGEFNKILSL